MKNNLIKTKNTKNICIGTGLIALDVIINGNPKVPPKLWTGGSCGNVLTILSYLGWESYPIARLKDDNAGKMLLRDLQKWNINKKLLSFNSNGSTPVIIERIGKSQNGVPWHRFEWTCPSCGIWLPKYKPVLNRDVEEISKILPKANTFYFDRVSRSSIELAKSSKKNGSFIIFEPSGIKEIKLFLECLELTDILKYSHEDLGQIQEITNIKKVPLEIETLGVDGIRYRFSSNKKNNSMWNKIDAFTVYNLIDAAGSGDWCSAGIIHILMGYIKSGMEELNNKIIEEALSFGQALASLNCCFEGARGCMYDLTMGEFKNRVGNILNKNIEKRLASNDKIKEIKTKKIFKHICPYCTNNN